MAGPMRGFLFSQPLSITRKFMKIICNLTLVISVLACGIMQVVSAQNNEKLGAKKVETPPVIDGATDAIWSIADSAKLEFQLSANYGKPIRSNGRQSTFDR